jgi:hypothetical protein
MQKIKGIIWIRMVSEGSKSDGATPFLIDHDFKHYKLSRKGKFEVNDNFFYPYQLKYVEIEGEISREEWIQVGSIEILEMPNISSD